MDLDRAGAWGAIEDGAMVIEGEVIRWIGPESELSTGGVGAAAAVIDLDGGWVTPGLIDCHTHLVFGGHRADEFEARLNGSTYEEIARAGGGILSTVRATRAAHDDELTASATRRLEQLVHGGCTTVEIKSGYGLDIETELRMLQAAREAGARARIDVSATLLAAHALPPEFAERRSEYVAHLCNDLIPAAVEAGQVDAVDAFCESIAFSAEECERVLRAGMSRGLLGRLHADQLTDGGGAALAARVGAHSADHLEYTSEAGAKAMGAVGTAAVLLPGAWYALGETSVPPVQAFRDSGVPLVVATDYNPGSSPLGSPLLAMNMACLLFGLTPAEALAGMTRNAAPVLGRPDRGVLKAGARADLACWAVDTPAELAYWIGTSPSTAVIAGGARLR